MSKPTEPMTMSGFCQFGPGAAHAFCVNPTCTCGCHLKEEK